MHTCLRVIPTDQNQISFKVNESSATNIIFGEILKQSKILTKPDLATCYTKVGPLLR